jgi:hypothetical protein
MVAEVADHMLTWKITVELIGMAQWLDDMWPSHGFPHGSGKIPDEDPRSEIQK